MNFSIFTVFLKNRNIISKMKSSKVTDYAALTWVLINMASRVKYDNCTLLSTYIYYIKNSSTNSIDPYWISQISVFTLFYCDTCFANLNLGTKLTLVLYKVQICD